METSRQALPRIEAARLEAWAAALLQEAGVDPADAAEVARQLVAADLRGVDTHGTSRLGIYLQRLEAGLIARRTEVRVLRETPVSALLDGQHGFGQVVAVRATDLAIRKAREAGVGIVVVRNSTHCGALAYFTLRMAAAGLIGFAATHAPASMPPWGGSQPFFGTNPLSWAFPAGDEGPVVLDMATSQVARGKIFRAVREGWPEIPPGWATDRQGVPTTDPRAAQDGMVLPAGGVKGYGLAMVVELLAGILSGAPFGPHLPRMYERLNEPQQLGHFFLALRPDLFLPEEEYRARVDRLVREVRAVPPAPGTDRVRAPGDVEAEQEAERRRLGIPLGPGVLQEFRELAGRYGVPLPPLHE